MPTSIASLLTDESHNMLARRHATSCTALFVEKCLHMWHSVRCLHCEKGDTFRLAVGDNLLKRYMSRQIIYCMCVYVHIWINLYTYVNLNKTVYIYMTIANIPCIWRHVPANCQTACLILNLNTGSKRMSNLQTYCVDLCARPCMREWNSHIHTYMYVYIYIYSHPPPPGPIRALGAGAIIGPFPSRL